MMTRHVQYIQTYVVHALAGCASLAQKRQRHQGYVDCLMNMAHSRTFLRRASTATHCMTVCTLVPAPVTTSGERWGGCRVLRMSRKAWHTLGWLRPGVEPLYNLKLAVPHDFLLATSTQQYYRFFYSTRTPFLSLSRLHYLHTAKSDPGILIMAVRAQFENSNECVCPAHQVPQLQSWTVILTLPQSRCLRDPHQCICARRGRRLGELLQVCDRALLEEQECDSPAVYRTNARSTVSSKQNSRMSYPFATPQLQERGL
jgi:hypothetical protein